MRTPAFKFNHQAHLIAYAIVSAELVWHFFQIAQVVSLQKLQQFKFTQTKTPQLKFRRTLRSQGIGVYTTLVCPTFTPYGEMPRGAIYCLFVNCVICIRCEG
jgi:hypothetical protein